MTLVRLISSLDVDAYVISSAYFALTVKECRMLNGCKGATSGFSAYIMCDLIVGLVRHVRVAVDESSNVRFRVVGVMTVPWQGRE